MYKIKFNSYQNEQFLKFTGTDAVKSKLQSVFAYLLKYPNINTKDLFNKYMHKTAKELRYSRQTFNHYLSILEDLKLIKRARKGLKTFFSIINLSTDVSRDLSTEKVTESVENTILDEILKSKNIKELKDINNISNIHNPVISTEEATKIAIHICKEFKIKSKIVYSYVLNKISCLTINKLGAVNYIKAIILNAHTKLQKDRHNFAVKRYTENNIKSTTVNGINAKSFNNFAAREYNWDSLEAKLLGWDK